MARSDHSRLLLRVLLLCLLAVLGTSRPAFAQAHVEAGRIEIWLERTPAPAVTITPAAGTLTVEGRRATISGIPPGFYQIAVGELSLTLSIAPGERVTLRQAGTLELVSRIDAGDGMRLTRRWFEDTASAYDVWSLIETIAAFVIADRMDSGGLATGRSALVGARGSSWTTTRLTWAGSSLVQPNAHGLIPLALDLSTAEAVSVISGSAPVEVATPGVAIVVTPRAPARGAAGPSGTFSASFTTPRMVTRNDLPDAPSIQRTEDWLAGQGLIDTSLSERTGLLLSGTSARIRFHERDLPVLWTSSTTTGLAHLVHQRAATGYSVLGSWQRTSSPFEGRRQLRDRFVDERSDFWQLSTRMNQVSTAGRTLTLLAGASGGRYVPDVPSFEGGSLDRVTDGFVPAPPTHETLTAFEVKATMSDVSRVIGPAVHDVRLGLTVGQTTRAGRTLATGDVAELVAGLPARVWRAQMPQARSRRQLVEISAYVADRMALAPRLSLEAGVRGDYLRGTIDGADAEVSWLTVSPRVSSQWSFGPAALFASASWYTEGLNFSQFAHGDPGEAVFDVHRWTDPDNNGRFTANEAGPLLYRAGRGDAIASLDSDLRAPRTREYSTGLDLRLSRHVSIRTAFVWRRQSDLLGSVNTGVPISAYTQRLVADPGADWFGPDDDTFLLVYDRRPESFGLDRYHLTNPEGGTATYEGIETLWTLRTRPVEMLFGAMAYRTRSWSGRLGFGPLENDYGIIGDVFEQPNARPPVQGSYFFDRSYVGKWSGSVRLPWTTRFGFAARYQDGQPFARVVVVPDLSTGPEMLHAYRVARTRYTYTLTLDMRLEKALRIAGSSAAFHIDVFNATQHTNEVEEDALTTPSFRRSTAVQPPLTVRAGFRFSW